jgi:hypothetical protein
MERVRRTSGMDSENKKRTDTGEVDSGGKDGVVARVSGNDPKNFKAVKRPWGGKDVLKQESQDERGRRCQWTTKMKMR